ncbi:HET-domain-containing protein, partial [Acephala macrosclerotiorum]
MDQKIAAFPYTALDTTKSEIRLIHLQPGRVTDEIKCELILASLNDKSTYEALSYEWGPPCPGVFGIKLNGQEHFVRENLWLALRCLRLEDGPRTFWIDAICIDQSNIPERNHQVDQMGRIYSQALGVV